MPHLGQSRRQLLHAFRHPDQGPHGIAQGRGFNQAFERGDQLRIVFTDRPTPAPGAANLSLRRRWRVEIILAAINRRTRQPGDVRHHRQTAPTGAPYLTRRKQSPSSLVQLRANRFPSLPNRVLVDHPSDLHPLALHRNPPSPSHSAAYPEIAIQLLLGVSLVSTRWSESNSRFIFSRFLFTVVSTTSSGAICRIDAMPSNLECRCF